MDNKVIAAIVVIVVAAALVGSYAYLSDDDTGPVTPALKEGFEVGDYYILQSETEGEGLSTVSYTTYTLTSIDGDSVTVGISTNGGEPLEMTFPAEEFPIGITYDDPGMGNMTMTGVEVVDTPFGELECEVWTSIFGTWAVTDWILPDSRVMVLEESRNTAAEQSMTNRLIGGSIFSNLGTGAGPEPTVPLEPRTEYFEGDYYTYEVRDGGSEPEAVTFTFLREEEGMDLVWRTDTGVQSTECFLDQMIPTDGMLEGMTAETTSILVTGFGDLLCDVWYDETGDGDVMLWIERDSGMLIRSECSRFVDGEYVTTSSTLTATSLLPASHPDDPETLGEVRTEAVDTLMGTVECDVYELADSSEQRTFWVLADGNVVLRTEYVQDGRTVYIELLDTSLLV